ALLAQLPNLMSSEAKVAAGRGFAELVERAPGPDSLLWLPARAFTGDPLPLAAIMLLSIGLFAWTVFGLADRFIASAVAAGDIGSSTAKTRRSRARRFHTGIVSVMRRKELRLLFRDPWLLTQVGQQMVYLVPALVLI